MSLPCNFQAALARAAPPPQGEWPAHHDVPAQHPAGREGTESSRLHAVQGGEAPDMLVGTLCRDFTDSTIITGQGYAMGVLMLPLTGAMVVSSTQGYWAVGANQVLWLVPHTAYKVRMQGKVRLRSLYLDPAYTSGLPPRGGLLRVTRLTRELISETATAAGPAIGRRSRTFVAALLEEIQHSSAEDRGGVATELAPRDPRLARVCTHVQQHLDDTKTLQEWAAEVGCDPRTLYRLFVQELGMPFVQWRQHLRLRTAMDWLADGKPVQDVAFDLGYQNQSAFTSMFKRQLGMAPSEFARTAAWVP